MTKQDVAVRALLDGNVLDLLADDIEALQIVTEALNEGRLELVPTCWPTSSRRWLIARSGRSSRRFASGYEAETL